MNSGILSKNDVAVMSRTWRAYDEYFPGAAVYDAKDRQRLEFAAMLVVGDAIADIGTGPGALAYHLAETNRCKRITTIDIATHSKLLTHESVIYRCGDLRDRTLDIGPHDTVFCMEVLEHIEEKHNDAALATLRKAAVRRLVVSVPDCEPEPLWWHDRPGGHRQQFTREKMAALFPRGIATVIPRYGVEWMLIVEDRAIETSEFQVLNNELLRSCLARFTKQPGN